MKKEKVEKEVKKEKDAESVVSSENGWGDTEMGSFVKTEPIVSIEDHQDGVVEVIEIDDSRQEPEPISPSAPAPAAPASDDESDAQTTLQGTHLMAVFLIFSSDVMRALLSISISFRASYFQASHPILS